jgi:leucyl-tRNA synthetase
VPEPSRELESISDYIRTTTTRVLAAHAAQQKRLAKGKGVLFDPSKDKYLNIYVAKSWPSWQKRYIDLVRDMFDGITLDVKSVAKQVEKADIKRAMPFVQELKRKLESGEAPNAVLDRTLAFDETMVLQELVPVLQSTVQRLKAVNVIVIDGETQDGGEADGKIRKSGIPQIATSAEPGNPAFEFLNL